MPATKEGKMMRIQLISFFETRFSKHRVTTDDALKSTLERPSALLLCDTNGPGCPWLVP